MTSRGLKKVPKRLSGKNIQLMDWHIAGPLYFDGVKGYFVTTSFMARPQSSYLNEIIIPYPSCSSF
jgi:hypothetical protein